MLNSFDGKKFTEINHTPKIVEDSFIVFFVNFLS